MVPMGEKSLKKLHYIKINIMLHFCEPLGNVGKNKNGCSDFIYHTIEEAILKYPDCPTELFEIDQIFSGQAFF